MRLWWILIVGWLVVAPCMAVADDIASSGANADKTNAKSAYKIEYPRRVVIPEEIPSVAVKCKQKNCVERIVLVPPALYLLGHYDGWQKCLKDCGLREIPGEAQSTAQTNEPYTAMGKHNGYNDCVRSLQRLMKSGRSRDALARICKDSIQPRAEDSLPPSPAD